MPTTLRDVRFQGQSGKHMLASSFSGFDPIETLVPHDGDRFGLRRQKRRSRAYTSELGQAEESLSRLR